MTGKSYYITTLADWRRYAHRFAQSHWIALDAPSGSPVGAQHAVPGDEPWREASEPAPVQPYEGCAVSNSGADPISSAAVAAIAPNDGASKILVLVEADEGVHLALEDDPAFEALPHPLAQKPISAAAQSALAPHGVAPGSNTFEAAEALAQLNPLMKVRVF